jgi:hypothetical protein
VRIEVSFVAFSSLCGAVCSSFHSIAASRVSESLLPRHSLDLTGWDIPVATAQSIFIKRVSDGFILRVVFASVDTAIVGRNLSASLR